MPKDKQKSAFFTRATFCNCSSLVMIRLNLFSALLGISCELGAAASMQMSTNFNIPATFESLDVLFDERN